MAKLYFRHGTVGSAKTLNLLAVAHNYRQQGKKVFLVKPRMESRFGETKIQSRAGLFAQADFLLDENTSLQEIPLESVRCILVDEAQFLSAKTIEELRAIATEKNIPVICYGLRTDFKSYLFEGAKRLMELADSIEEVKATCHFCNKKSIMNLKHVNGVAVKEGPSIELGAEEKYFPSCYECFCYELQRAEKEKLVNL